MTRKEKVADDNWENAKGVPCEACGRETNKTHIVCKKCVGIMGLLYAIKYYTPEKALEFIFPKEEWELTDKYEFKKRTSYIYKNKQTKLMATLDIDKGGNEWKSHVILNIAQTLI